MPSKGGVRECGCHAWVKRCRHIDGLWVLAILESVRPRGKNFVVVACPGFKLGRDKEHDTFKLANEDFDRRAAAMREES